MTNICSSSYKHFKQNISTGEMDQQLRACAVLAENLSLVLIIILTGFLHLQGIWYPLVGSVDTVHRGVNPSKQYICT